ncbi:MAG: hypothetical protein M3450_08140 [Actinomycetota bacterium]|nr:hypothetical protein [Actinomycetota bacterium]
MDHSDDARPAKERGGPARPSSWHLHAVVDEQTCDELRGMAARIEQALRELVPILDRCYRVQQQSDAAVGRASSTDEVPHSNSGAGHLSELLYLPAAHVDAAAGENVEDIDDIAWLKARATLGLDDFPIGRGEAEPTASANVDRR